MSIFITKITLNNFSHLNNLSIEIDDSEKKHLILTGTNGAGKSVLLSAIADFLQHIKQNESGEALSHENDINIMKEPAEIYHPTAGVHNYEDRVNNQGKSDSETIDLTFNNIEDLKQKLIAGNFLLSYYDAGMKTNKSYVQETAASYLKAKSTIFNPKITEFHTFLVDLKLREKLARQENNYASADEIKIWFDNFTILLTELLGSKKLDLRFSEYDYTFTIVQNEREFKFTELSDGYSTIIDLVADLIIKMQIRNTLTKAYEMEGIVLIDEVEAHLHLKLQRLLLPMLTKIFPNIQFIITTHSPFVLNSVSNAVAFDLDKAERYTDLTKYSYEALAEGYFEVETDSIFLLDKLKRFQQLSITHERDIAEETEYQMLDQEFASMNELLTPQHIKGRYLEVKLGIA